MAAAPAGTDIAAAWSERLRDPARRRDPHPLYHRMRAEAPIYHDPASNVFVLTRYADCDAVLRDHRWSTNPDGLLFLDPADHTRIRQVVGRRFTPRAIEQWDATIRDIVTARLVALGALGEIDVVADFARDLPSAVMGELLGVPPADRAQLGVWALDVSRLLDGFVDEAATARGQRSATELLDYLEGLVADRRVVEGRDLLSELTSAGESSGRLTDDELRSLLLVLLAAGQETTPALVTNAVKALLEHPEQLARLREDPTLIGATIEEALRFDGPVYLAGRFPTETIDIGGRRFEPGHQVVVLLAAANRDPAVFDAPDRFDIGRSPNPHLAFAKGPHHCLGAALARLVGRRAVGGLMARLPDMHLLTSDPDYRKHFAIRGLLELRVALR